MHILVTGGAGFIGHHFVEHLLKTTTHDITIIDRLTYASSGFDRLRDIGAYNNPRVKVFTHDFSQPINEFLAYEVGRPDVIMHMGAETHVDNSIKDPEPFVKANVIGTYQMLEFAKSVRPHKFFYFSTDEVFGDAPAGVSYKEWDRYNSRNPYAATKAGGEEMCLAYANSYDLPVIITHAMNQFGERQHKEKFIPIVINKLRFDSKLEIHCKDGEPASRSWIHCRNTSSALMHLIDNAKPMVRGKVNITGQMELNNLDLALLIAKIMGKELKYELTNYYADRHGHDPRYMLDGEVLGKMGWKMPVDFEESLEKTVKWSLDHPKWLDW